MSQSTQENVNLSVRYVTKDLLMYQIYVHMSISTQENVDFSVWVVTKDLIKPQV